MPTITASPMVDLDQLCANMTEQELGLLASKAVRHSTVKFGTSLPLTLRDENQTPVATVSPVEELISEEEEKSDFIMELKRRVANPAPEYLSPDELLAAIARS